MKRILLLLLIGITALSCGSDDGGNAKRPSAVTIVGGGVSYLFSMDYDNKGRLETLMSNVEGDHTYTFSYNEAGKVSTVVSTGSSNSTMTFTYDGEGRLATFTRSGQEPLNATWAGNSIVTLGDVTIKLDNKGDIMMYDIVSFTRDSGKGPFASVKGVDPLTMILVEQATLYFSCRKPIKTLSGAGTTLVLDNEFSGGYLSGASFVQDNATILLDFTY